MDPSFVSNPIWHDLSTMLRFLWVYVFFIIGAAFNFLVAHAVLPSLANSGQIPAKIARLRVMFYLSALGSLALALAFLILTFVNTGVLAQVWGRVWI